MCSPAVTSILFCMVVVVAAPWPLVGREGELTRIAAAVYRAAPGGVMLTGPAGMGRSRLARECTAIGAAAGFVCEQVLATPSLSGLPLGSLAPLLPPVPEDTESRDDLVSWAVDAILADRERLFLVVDDAHLLDETSAEVVRRLVLVDSTFVVMTVRRGARVSTSLERIDVEPLARHDLDSLIDAVLGGWVDGITRHDLWEYTGGSPQLLRELVLAALDAGALRKNDGVWRLGNEWAAAPRLVDLVSTRMAGLGTEERDLLDLLALAGPLDLPAIGDLGITPETIDILHDRDLVVRGERIRLAHPLHGRVLHAGLATIGRAAATRRLAAAGIRLASDSPAPMRAVPDATDILDIDAVVDGYAAAVSARDRFRQAWFAFLRGRHDLVTGDLVTAGGWFSEAAAAFDELGEEHHRRRCLAGRIIAAAQRNDTDDVSTTLASLGTPTASVAEVGWAMGWVAVVEGDPGSARGLLAGAADAAEACGALDVAVEAWHDLARLGDPVPAAAALDRLRNKVPGKLAELFAVHAAGLAAGDPVILGDVADRFEKIGAVLFAAEAAAAASAGHLRRRDRRAVRRLAGQATALAERCNASTPALLLAGPAAALTAREHEIAALAARGLASKTIAGRIGIGVRTVECHLQRAYQKLGVSNRSDLAAALAA